MARDSAQGSDRNVLGLTESPEVLTSGAWLETIFGSLGTRPPRLLIGNEWVEAQSGRVGETFDPSTGKKLGEYAIGDASDVDRAVTAAKQAAPAWAALSLDQRAAHLSALRERILANRNLFATLDAVNAGLSVEAMHADIESILRVLVAWPALASGLRGEVLHDGKPGLHFTRYSPFGVVARIVAYNHPILFAVKGSLAALLAGNCIVLKPAEQAPFSALVLGDLIREVFPPGVFNIVTGDAKAGEAMVTHPDIRRIAFTGSIRTGRMIQEAAARDRVRTVSLELGGKNAMIVFPDVSIPTVARDVVFGMNLRANGGQSCGSTSRVFVHKDIHDEFVSELTRAMAELKLGPAYHSDIDMGPVISDAAAQRIRRHIQGAIEQGATLATGGLDDARLPAEGNFVAPTLFTDVPADSTLASEEIFGPVVALTKWDDYESMMRIVNGLDYGLTASVWTNDITTALSTAERVEAGYVWINQSTTHYFGMPFGGWKDSGIGREECLDEFKSFLQVKSVHVKLP